MTSAKSYLISDYSLGDLVAVLYTLENVGRQKGIDFSIKIKGLNSIYDCFEFDHIKIGNSKNDLKDILKNNHINFCDKKHYGYFYKKYNFISVLLNYFVRFFDYEPTKSLPLVSKEKSLGKNDLTYVQFDGRTCTRQNRNLRFFQKSNILRSIPKWSCLGGLDTKKYLGKNANYELGDPNFIIKKMISCKKFIGCDSGMSHIAGCLGVDSNIYIAGNCFYCLSNYYEKSYRNCKVFRPTIKLI